MKLIMSIIRIAKMNETKKALSDAGLPSFMATSVMGRGIGRGLGSSYEKLMSDPGNKELLAQIGAEPRLKSKRFITLVVHDDKKDLAIETLIKANQTGNSGDGKIWVTECYDAIRVRTAERGDIVLD